LTITEVVLRRPFARYRAGRRALQEVEYAVKAFRAIRRVRPDIAVLCNIPLLANFLLVLLLDFRRVPYVFWHQDIYSEAIRDEALKRFPRPIGHLIGAAAEGLEKYILRRSRRVVAITDAFRDKYTEWGIADEAYEVIPNWAQVEQFANVSGGREWLDGEHVRRNIVLYSGTLGAKHDPGLLLGMATSKKLEDCTVLVVSEGKGREWLADRQGAVQEGRLVLRDYVPFQKLPTVLASADVLISILEPAASRFSVPSKVLTYLSAGRPVLAVMDADNAAAKLLTEHGAGLVMRHDEAQRLETALRGLLDDPSRMAEMGRSARRLAERLFDIEKITSQFEDVIGSALAG